MDGAEKGPGDRVAVAGRRFLSQGCTPCIPVGCTGFRVGAALLYSHTGWSLDHLLVKRGPDRPSRGVSSPPNSSSPRRPEGHTARGPWATVVAGPRRRRELRVCRVRLTGDPRWMITISTDWRCRLPDSPGWGPQAASSSCSSSRRVISSHSSIVISTSRATDPLWSPTIPAIAIWSTRREARP